MTTWIDKKYLNLISPQLELFKWKSNNIANHRCPFCGDSKKNKFKTRGYHYEKKGGLFYKCHNCQVGMTTSNFLKRLDDRLYKEYIMERYKSGENGSSTYKKPKDINKSKKPEFTKKPKRLLDSLLDNIESLPEDHEAVNYLKDRLVPRECWDELYYIDDFKKIDQLSKNVYKKATDNEKRILIPFYDKNSRLTGFTARTIDPNNTLRYFTIRLNSDLPMIYNLDRVNFNETIYVFEGPIDSMFIKNSVGVGGTNLKQISQFLPKKNCVLVFDNQPKNKELTKIIQKAIDNNFTVSFLPNDFGGKDINDAIKMGMSPNKIIEILEENKYNGLQAQVKFNEWRGIK